MTNYRMSDDDGKFPGRTYHGGNGHAGPGGELARDAHLTPAEMFAAWLDSDSVSENRAAGEVRGRASEVNALIAGHIAQARREGVAEVEAKALALADEWYPGPPGPRRMVSWGQLAMEKCARELRAALRGDDA